MLTARIAVAFVTGVQSAGVAATVKHYVANDSETERWTYDARSASRCCASCTWRRSRPASPRRAPPWSWPPTTRSTASRMTEHAAAEGDAQGRMGLRRRGRLGLERRPQHGGDRRWPGWTWPCPARTGPGAEAWSRRSGPGVIPEAVIDDKVMRHPAAGPPGRRAGRPRRRQRPARPAARPVLVAARRLLRRRRGRRRSCCCATSRAAAASRPAAGAGRLAPRRA